MGISVWQLLILLAVVLLIFGTKKLKNIGGDLGGAIKGFKSAVQAGDKDGDGAASATQNKVAQDSSEDSASTESVKKEDKV